jgi:hypothetical protein
MLFADISNQQQLFTATGAVLVTVMSHVLQLFVAIGSCVELYTENSNKARLFADNCCY